MSVAQMQKISIFIHEAYAKPLLTELQSKSIIEITEVDNDLLCSPEESLLRSLDCIEVLDFLEQLFPREKNFVENFINMKTILTQPEAAVLLKNHKLKSVLGEFRKYQERWLSLRQELQRLEQAEKHYTLFKNFDLAWGKSSKVKKLANVFGFYSLAQYQKLKELPQDLLGSVEQITSQDSKNIYICYWFLPEGEKDFKAKISVQGFTTVVVPDTKESYLDKLYSVQKDIKLLQKEQQQLKNILAKRYAAEKRMLDFMADYLANQESLHSQSKDLLKTKKIVLIEGWIIKKRYPELIALTTKYEKYSYVVDAVVSVDEVPPIVLSNAAVGPLKRLPLFMVSLIIMSWILPLS